MTNKISNYPQIAIEANLKYSLSLINWLVWDKFKNEIRSDINLILIKLKANEDKGII